MHPTHSRIGIVQQKLCQSEQSNLRAPSKRVNSPEAMPIGSVKGKTGLSPPRGDTLWAKVLMDVAFA